MKYAKLLVIGLILLAICGYYHRIPTDDDAWFAEESYFLLHEGQIRSEFFRGLLGWESYYFLSHKLFIALGAALQYLFPLSPYTSKLSGLIFFIALIFLFKYYLKNQSKIFFLLLLILIFSNTLLIKMSFENRPELMLTTLGFASFILIYNNNSLLKSGLSGILAGLAVLSHLNGLIYVSAGFVMLLCAKRYLDSCIFIITAILTSSLYFGDILYFNGFQTWWFQFRNDPATQNSFGFIEKIKVIITYPKLFFESPEQAVLTLLLIVLGWHCRKVLRQINTNLVVYALALFCSFWLLTKRASGIYQILFIPTIFAIILDLYSNSPRKSFGKAVYIMVFLYLCVGIIGNSQIIYKNAVSHDLPQQYADLSKKITEKKVGIVPITFFFNEYPKYQRLLCQTNFELQSIKEKNLTISQFVKWANQNNASFIILDYKNGYSNYYPVKGAVKIGDYKIIYSDNQFVVYVYRPI